MSIRHEVPMIAGDELMIAACMERMRAGACGACAGHGLRGPPSGDCPHPVRRMFARLLGELAEAARAHERSRKSALRREVERHMEALLETGSVPLDRVADAVGCSSHTLARRLRAEGTGFQEVLTGVRRRAALRLLGRERLSVKETGYRLGFSDPAAFSRAFKRWTGKNPRDVRGRPA